MQKALCTSRIFQWQLECLLRATTLQPATISCALAGTNPQKPTPCTCDWAYYAYTPKPLCLQALLPGRATYTDLLAALQRRGTGLSVVTGGVQPHRWLVLAALKVAEVRRWGFKRPLSPVTAPSEMTCLLVGRNHCAVPMHPERAKGGNKFGRTLWWRLTQAQDCALHGVGVPPGSEAADLLPMSESHLLLPSSWQGPAAEGTAAAPASRHPELFKAMAAGVGQDSTALISPSWPHALRLMQVGI